mmetsp:Transcript_15207/g.18592  ORF Transcript_15207/g.18592 Transcript_15207/m.18592 type:complete len:285 (-) Transcript_15207:54-908(-)
MTILKAVAFSILALLAVAEECQNCETDDLELLQAKAQEKFPDLSGILGGGIGKMTSNFGDTIDKVNTQLTQAETKFNESLAKFNAAANATATVVQNMTKFKALIKDTIATYVPFYDKVLKQVTDAVKTTKAVATMIGQEELLEKLNDINQTAMEKLGALGQSTEALASEVADAGEDKFGDIADDVKGKLDSMLSTTSSFRESFNSKVETFMDALESPMKIALGDDGAKDILKLKTQAQGMLQHFEDFATIVKTGLTTASDGVDTELAKASRKGFFGRIFGGLFR